MWMTTIQQPPQQPPQQPQHNNNVKISITPNSPSQRRTPSRTVVTSFTPRQRTAAAAAAAAAAATGSSNSSSILTDPSTPSTNTTAYEDGDWVLCLASSSSSSISYGSSPIVANTISCALSNGFVQVYDQTTLLPIVSYHLPQLHGSSTTNNTNHNSPLVTDMKYGIQNTSNTLFTTSNDGSFHMKDLRQPSNTMESINIATYRRTHNESLLSLALGYDGSSIVALGSSKGHVHFIDLRMLKSSSSHQQPPQLLGSYIQSHSDAITQVTFHPQHTSLLMSASEDGLINIYDTTKSSEDLALEIVMNTGTPCRKVGFCGNDNNNHQYIYCLSGSETVSIWDSHTAVCINNFHNFSLRETLEATATIPIHYLVDAKWDNNNHLLQLCAGNQDGNTAIFTCHNVQQSNSVWHVRECLMGGHHGIVRAWCPISNSTSSNNGTAIQHFTAGEDARICEWNCSDNSNKKKNVSDESMFESEMIMDDGTVVNNNNNYIIASTTNQINNNNTNNNTNTTISRTGGPIRRQRNNSVKPNSTKPY